MVSLVNAPADAQQIVEAIELSQRDAVWTSGQISQLCKVAPKTACEWIDSGKLPGYRIPVTKARRVRASDLHAFLLEHGLTAEARLVCPRKILIVGVSRAQSDAMRERIPGGVEMEAAVDSFVAGLAMGGARWPVIVCEFSERPDEVGEIARRIRAIEEMKGTKLIAVVGEDQPVGHVLPADVHFDRIFQRPFYDRSFDEAIAEAFSTGGKS